MAVITGGYPMHHDGFSKDPLAFLHFIRCPLLRLPCGYHGKIEASFLAPHKAPRPGGATVNQHPPVHHPLDACYDSVGDG